MTLVAVKSIGMRGYLQDMYLFFSVRQTDKISLRMRLDDVDERYCGREDAHKLIYGGGEALLDHSKIARVICEWQKHLRSKRSVVLRVAIGQCSEKEFNH